MDVTEMGFHRLPFDRLSLHNLVTSARVDGLRPAPRGPGGDPARAGSPPDDDLTLTVTMRTARGAARSRSRAVRDWWVDGRRLHYRMEVDLSKAVGELDQVNPVWDLRLEISAGTRPNVVEVRDRPGDGVRPADPGAHPARRRRRRLRRAVRHPTPRTSPSSRWPTPPLSAGRRAGRRPAQAGRASRCAGGRARRSRTTPP